MVRQLMTYLTGADLLPPLQSGFRPGHSTESAILCVLSDILLAVDRGDFAALVLLDLDLSAAFDTVDHDILLQRLESSFGIADVARDWFRSSLGPKAICLSLRSTVYICLLTIVFRACARQSRIVSRYTPCERARCIELLLFHFPCAICY